MAVSFQNYFKDDLFFSDPNNLYVVVPDEVQGNNPPIVKIRYPQDTRHVPYPEDEKYWEEYETKNNFKVKPTGLLSFRKFDRNNPTKAGKYFKNTSFYTIFGDSRGSANKKFRSWATDAFYNLVKKGYPYDTTDDNNRNLRNNFGKMIDIATFQVIERIHEFIYNFQQININNNNINYYNCNLIRGQTYDFVLKGGRSMIENFRRTDGSVLVEGKDPATEGENLINLLGGYSDYDFAAIITDANVIADKNLYERYQHNLQQIIQYAFLRREVLEPYIQFFHQFRYSNFNGNTFYGLWASWLKRIIDEEMAEENKNADDTNILRIVMTEMNNANMQTYEDNFPIQYAQSRVNWKTTENPTDTNLHFDLSRLFGIKYLNVDFYEGPNRVQQFQIPFQIELIDIACENYGKHKPEKLLRDYMTNTQPLERSFMGSQYGFRNFNIVYNLHDLLEVLRDRFVSNDWNKIQKRKNRLNKLYQIFINSIINDPPKQVESSSLIYACNLVINCANQNRPEKFNLTSEAALQLIDIFLRNQLGQHYNRESYRNPLKLAFAIFSNNIYHYDSIFQLDFFQNIGILQQKLDHMEYIVTTMRNPYTEYVGKFFTEFGCEWINNIFRFYPSGTLNDDNDALSNIMDSLHIQCLTYTFGNMLNLVFDNLLDYSSGNVILRESPTIVEYNKTIEIAFKSIDLFLNLCSSVIFDKIYDVFTNHGIKIMNGMINTYFILSDFTHFIFIKKFLETKSGDVYKKIRDQLKDLVFQFEINIIRNATNALVVQNYCEEQKISYVPRENNDSVVYSLYDSYNTQIYTSLIGREKIYYTTLNFRYLANNPPLDGLIPLYDNLYISTLDRFNTILSDKSLDIPIQYRKIIQPYIDAVTIIKTKNASANYFSFIKNLFV